MTLEADVQALSAAVTLQTQSVSTQQTGVDAAVGAFAATTAAVAAIVPDLDKPVSTATSTALGTKQDALQDGVNISTVNGVSLLGGTPLVIERSATSLSHLEYDNRDSLRLLSPALNDSVVIDPLGLFMWHDSITEPDDDETCFNTSGGQWLLELPAWELIDAITLFDRAVIDEWMEDEESRISSYS